MLRLIYSATPAGAPDQYGDAVDTLRAADGTTLQTYPKTQAGFTAPAAPLAAAIDAWLTKRGPRSEPVVVMVHGYQFDPSKGIDALPDSPFGTIYGLPPAVNACLSWLPLVGECDATGGSLAENAVGFCYKSDSGSGEFTRAGWDNSYQYAVFDQAPLASRALASILAQLGTRAITLRVLAHSLGTRTFSQAIGLLRGQWPANLDRAVLLDGAEFSVDAAANFAGCSFDVINIANRTDQVLLAGGQKACHPMRQNNSLPARNIGFDGLGTIDRWLDLQLDNPALVTWFAENHAPTDTSYKVDAHALETSHPFAQFDHWCCYTNEGNRSLVRDLLFSDAMTVGQMKARGVPAGVASVGYGQFDSVKPPATPGSLAERRRALSSGDGGGGSSG